MQYNKGIPLLLLICMGQFIPLRKSYLIWTWSKPWFFVAKIDFEQNKTSP